MTTIIVGLGEFAVSGTPGDVLKTFALGSCIGVTMVDPDTGVTGMLHLVLPEASTNPERAERTPGYFADTGIPALVDAMVGLGCRKSRRWVVKIAGGAKVLKGETCEALEIGKRNALATKKNLWRLGLGAVAEDIGETHSRTLSVEVGSTKVSISNAVLGTRQI